MSKNSNSPRMIGFVYSGLGCLICEYRRDCTAPNKVSCHQSKNYDLQSVCSTCCTCKNVQYMYHTFSVAVSVAVMLLRAGFHCGSAAPLLVFRGLKRHHYHSDRGSSWSSEAAAHRELLLRFLTKNCEPRSRLDLLPVLCIVLYARILKFKF